jgi:hypothetical protein
LIVQEISIIKRVERRFQEQTKNAWESLNATIWASGPRVSNHGVEQAFMPALTDR